MPLLEQCMNGSRPTRIAVTSLSLAACMLLGALWVRSYRWRDFVKHDHPSRDIALESYCGEVCFSVKTQYAPPDWLPFWLVGHEPITATTTPPLSSPGGKPIAMTFG